MDWQDLPLHETALLCTMLGLLASAACSRGPTPAVESAPSTPTAVTMQAAPPPSAPPVATGAAAAASQRNVFVNGQPIPAAQLAELENHFHLQIANGQYWYDRVSGAAGPAGGPTLAFIVPGLDLGGPLTAQASNGNTGVFINGRELPQYDLIALTRLVGFVQPGRYFLDAMGNAGYEGGPPMINLVAASRQQQTQGGGGDGWYSSNVNAGGNESGGTGYVMGKDASGNTWGASY